MPCVFSTEKLAAVLQVPLRALIPKTQKELQHVVDASCAPLES
jgi:hypothetical protein